MKTIRLVFPLLIIFMFVGKSFSSAVMTDGAKAGVWTMDYDAALKLAKSKNLPLFLNFTGSDWCVWCKLMQEKVFSQKEWNEYAKDNLVLVTLDFPKDQSIVPEKYKSRNQALQAEMGVRGYPSFILLDSDGKTKLGQLSAGQDKTPENFIGEVNQAMRSSSSAVDKFAATLSKKQSKAYKKYWAQLKETQTERDNWLATNPQESEENLKKFDTFNTKINDYERKIRTVEIDKYAKKLSNTDASKYRKLNKTLTDIQSELESWLLTRPERSQENTDKFAAYQSDIQKTSSEIRSFEN